MTARRPAARDLASFARRYLPIIDWAPAYRREDLTGDIIAGLIVTIMLVPQSMAYAMLAGLPPEVGLYASIVPPILYAIFGSSKVLAVGPTAVMSLMTATTLGAIAEQGSEIYLASALTLAAMSGVILLSMGLVRLGFLMNFLSHPVISGFTSAAALIIGFSQLKHLLGMDIPRSHLINETIGHAVEHAADANLPTVIISVVAIGLLLLARKPLSQLLTLVGTPAMLVTPLTKAGPLVIVVIGTLVVWRFNLNGSSGVQIVGAIPAGLPNLTLPPAEAEFLLDLLPGAFLIAIVGFIESVSVARALAAKKRQKIDANQELTALGLANIGTAFTGGAPVTGGFARSVVNSTGGANTALAGVITALLIALTVAFFTPLFHYLPKAVLSSIIVVAIASLVDIKTLSHVWRYNKADAASLIVTFFAVLTLGIEIGIIAGAGIAIALYLWRTSHPHMAIVGRVGDTEHYRNIKRHAVRTWPSLLAIRVDENLYFANTNFLEEQILGHVADREEVEHLVLICSAVNFIDASALETLERLVEELGESGVTVHLAEVKGPVMDALKKSHFLKQMGDGQVFFSTDNAIRDLTKGDGEVIGPLGV